MWLRPNFWPTLLAVAGRVMLLALGSWQLQRLAWKNAFLSDLSRG